MIDLLVAGGGPIGLATAILAARAGLEAVVVEPRAYPVDKACGEGLMPAAVRMLRDDLDVRPETLQGKEFSGIRYVTADGSARSDARFGSGVGLGVRRTRLSEALQDKAIGLGVRFVRGRVREVRQDAAGVEAAGLRARWLAAADGLHSPIRRTLGLDIPCSAGNRRYGLRAHVELEPWSELVEVHWAERSEAYVTPLGVRLTGIAVLTCERATYHDHLRRFPFLARKIARSPTSVVRAAGPMRQRARSRVAGRVLLVGDAAGYLDALTGEGIALGLGQARALVAAITSGRPEAYETAWRRITRSYRLLTGALLAARRRPVLARRIVPAAARLPGLFAAAVDTLADDDALTFRS